MAANVENSGNLTRVREKSGKVENVREHVFCLFCVTVIAIVAEKAVIKSSAVTRLTVQQTKLMLSRTMISVDLESSNC